MAQKLLKKSVLSVLTVVVTLILGIALTGSEAFHDPFIIPGVTSSEGIYIPAGADTDIPTDTPAPDTTIIPPETSDTPISTETADSVTEPPETEPPFTEPPVTEPPVTEPPVTEPPATEPPETDPAEPVPVSSVSISTLIPYLHVGSKIKFNVTVAPDNAGDKSVTWSVTGGTGSAVIDEDGVLTAAKAGTVKVTATANDGSGISVTHTVIAVSDSTTIVGISNMGNEYKTRIYSDAIGYTGATSVILPMISTDDEAAYIIDRIDALVMTGGEDIAPSYYGETPSKKLGTVFAARDVNDVLLIRYALDRDLPLLGICRGMQIINVVCGGTLVQDIPTEIGKTVIHIDPALRVFQMHKITASDDSLIRELLGGTSAIVNSWHHQAVEKLGSGLKITAVAADGIPEAIEMEGKTFVLGVQFHPERMIYDGNTDYVGFFNALVSSAQKRRSPAETN